MLTCCFSATCTVCMDGMGWDVACTNMPISITQRSQLIKWQEEVRGGQEEVRGGQGGGGRGGVGDSPVPLERFLTLGIPSITGGGMLEGAPSLLASAPELLLPSPDSPSESELPTKFSFL